MILVTCSDHGIAVFAKILKTIFDMLLIIGPILAIVSLGVLFFRLMVFDYNEKTNVNAKVKYINLKNQIKNALIALVIVIFLPVFVNLIMAATFMKDTFQIAQCFSEAKGVSFSTKGNNYIKKKDTNKNNTGTLIIDPSKYKGTDENPNASEGKYGNSNSDDSPTPTGEIETNPIAGNRESQIQGAISWAIAIANDNSFNYGVKPYASRGGCYFCKTNGGKKRAAAGHSDGTPPAGKTWDKTYVCMTFVNAAYAHGAKDPIFLKSCKNGSSVLDGNARVKPTLKKLGNRVTNVGKPAYSKLQAGDILFMEGVHVAMYIGNGKYVEATSGSGPWSPKSIAVKNFSKHTYSHYTAVLRYNGY